MFSTAFSSFPYLSSTLSHTFLIDVYLHSFLHFVCVFSFFQSTRQWYGKHFTLFISRSRLLHDRPLVCSCTTSFSGLFPGSSSPQHRIPVGTQSTDTFIRLCHRSGALRFNGNTDTHGSSLICMTISIMDFCDWSRLMITAVMQNAALWTYSISKVTEFTFHFNIRRWFMTDN